MNALLDLYQDMAGHMGQALQLAQAGHWEELVVCEEHIGRLRERLQALPEPADAVTAGQLLPLVSEIFAQQQLLEQLVGPQFAEIKQQLAAATMRQRVDSVYSQSPGSGD